MIGFIVVTVPWKSVWPSSYTEFGRTSNAKTYPGEGHNNDWFHCSSGTRNIIARQQSVAFTDPYTDSTKDKAGFVTTDTSFPANAAGKKVGVWASQATTTYFLAQEGTLYTTTSTVTAYDTVELLWTALTAGSIDAAYVGSSDFADKTASLGATYVMKHDAAGWSNGVAYGCSPEYGDVVAALNTGLVAFKATAAYTTLCAKYPAIDCDTTGATFSNTQGAPYAKHPATRADIVIGTEADWGVYNKIEDGVLKGFDIELTEAVCAAAGKRCAIVTVPWKSVWPSSYPEFNWDSNSKTYPGHGHNNDWFHCTSGTRNIIARQQSVAFTNPYTDPSKDKAGFVTTDTSFPADAASKEVGVQAAQATTTYFL